MDQTILDLEQISEALQDRRLYVVADVTGLSYPTVKKLADGVEANYTIDTLKKISAYITKPASK